MPYIIGCIIAAIVFFIAKYLLILPMTTQYSATWITVIVCLALADIIAFLLDSRKQKTRHYIGFCAAILFFIWLGCRIFSTPLAQADVYASRIEVEEGVFDEDIPKTADLKKIPLMDSSTAAIMGNRAIGDLADVVSQYVVEPDEYSTIIYQGKVVKVAPLEYDGFFKWMNNHDKGIPGYVIVDPETNSAEYVKLDTPIKYSGNAYFSENIIRHARKHYPDKLFGNCMFQLDDEGTPVWTLMTFQNKTMFGAWKADGVVIVNASTGETEWKPLEDAPEWIDNLYTGGNAVSLYDDYGMLQNGFWNTLFSQVGCTRTTNDYGYLAIGNDVYYYTGVTSAASDNSNIGFLLVNSRTGEFKFYSSPGADEHSAMDAAEGALQNYGYVASFPSLINVGGEPVYAMALKDSSGLVKAYAFVNEKHYSVVGTGDTLNEAMNNYRNNLKKDGYDLQDMIGEENAVHMTETVTSVQFVIVDNVTYTYVKAGSGKIYKQIFEETHLFIETGNEVAVTYDKAEAEKPIISATIQTQ